MPHVKVDSNDAPLAEAGAAHLLEASLVLDAAVVRQAPAVCVLAQQATEGVPETVQVNVPCPDPNHLNT